MFDRKLNLEDIKPLVDEIKKYINIEISDRFNRDNMYINKSIVHLRERVSDLERDKLGIKPFRYIETGLTIDQAIERLKDCKAVRNMFFKDDIYIVANFESHIKSPVVGYQTISYITGKIIDDNAEIHKQGHPGCIESGWSVIDV